MKILTVVKIVFLLMAASLFSGCGALNCVNIKLDGMPALIASGVSRTYDYVTTESDGGYDGELVAFINKRANRQYIVRVKAWAPSERPHRPRSGYFLYIGSIGIKNGRALMKTSRVSKIWMSPPAAPRITIYTKDGKKNTFNNSGPGRVVNGRFLSRNVLVLALPPGRYEITFQAQEGIGMFARFGRERAFYVDLYGNHPKNKRLGNMWVNNYFTL